MKHGFMAGSAHIDQLDAAAEGLPILLATRDDLKPQTVMSNSFGFGGTNASLVMRALK